MTSPLFGLARSFLRNVDPERAHGLAIQALAGGLHPRQRERDPDSLKISLFGLDFANPVGMAAGFDKDAQAVDGLLALGFGFTECGTITPLPQPGNPRPRVFRLEADKAVINRLGFNSGGHAAALERLKKRPRRGIVGVNIGANRESADRVGDYVAGIRAFAPVASYFTVNISSPNTPRLRDMQARDTFDDLLAKVMAARQEAAGPEGPRPLLVKIAPDMADDALKDIVELSMRHGIDGLIVSNTTIGRPGLKEAALAAETGGLSGAPLFDLATRMLARTYALTGGALPLVGVGGVSSAETAYAKIKAGASLVQLYTALIFEGPELLWRIKKGLAEALARDGFASLSEAVGTDHASWLDKGDAP